MTLDTYRGVRLDPMSFAVLVFALFLLCSCGAGFYSASTTASVTVSPDGTRIITYESNKEENGLDATWDELPGNVKHVHVAVQKAGTSESAIAAAAQAQLELMKLLQQLVPLLAEAAKIGATRVP